TDDRNHDHQFNQRKAALCAGDLVLNHLRALLGVRQTYGPMPMQHILQVLCHVVFRDLEGKP
ncbi:MAG: hypothetical protein M3Q28_04060, partial [Pseudomonadota bacterium]|nr:hypothetical protein [Pseudomonadota bacterium]